MSKNKKAKQAFLYKKQQQKAHSPSARLQEAQQALQRDEALKALNLAEIARRGANDPTTVQKIQQVLIESHFRLAAGNLNATERLQHLDQALKLAPHQARLHYHRGITLWRMGQVEQALAAFEQTAVQEPTRAGLRFLRQLGKVALGKPWEENALSGAETNTLRYLQQVQGGEDLEQALRRSANQPLLGDTPRLWEVLAQMAANPKASPAVEWQKALEQSGNGTNNGALTTNPLVGYYQGVVAMRKGDVVDAVTAWRQASHTLSTPWLQENLLNSRRDLAVALAKEQRWQEITAVYEQTKADHPNGEIDSVLVEAAGIAYANLGFVEAQNNQWLPAGKHFRAATELAPSRLIFQNLALAEEATSHWNQAAEAWREMVKRRPRKENHPDYLTDDQVAALWQHAATCYEQVPGQEEEVITCLKNAIKYAPNDVAIRMNLADAMHGEGREEAVENELQRILEIDPNHVQALMRLGMLYTNRWDRDAKPIWERVLALEPNNSDAQQALAMTYLGMATGGFGMGGAGMGMPSFNHTPKQALKTLEEGLQALPNHPLLLMGLGKIYQETKDNDKARSNYAQAGQAALASKELPILASVVHELLHVDGGDQVKELTPQISQFSGLLSGFWMEQAEKVMGCELGENWAEFFWDEAVRLAENSSGRASISAILLNAFHEAFQYDIESASKKYETRLRKEYPSSGAIEFIDAVYLLEKNPNKTSPVLALLRKAKTVAQKAKQTEIVTIIDEFEQEVKYPGKPNLFGGDMARIMKELLEDFDEDELDALRRLF